MKIRLISLALITTFFAFSLNAAEYTGRLSMHWNDKHHCTKHAQMFVDEVFEKSNGRLKIEVFHSGQLFGIREIMGGITSGAVDLGGVVGVVGFPKINKIAKTKSAKMCNSCMQINVKIYHYDLYIFNNKIYKYIFLCSLEVIIN